MVRLEKLSMFLFLLIITVSSGNGSPINSLNNPDLKLSPCLHDCSIKAGFCENGGTCMKLDDGCFSASFSCLCPKGFKGTRCSEVDEPCKYDQAFFESNCGCQNGATCLKLSEECQASSYVCKCTAGFEGALCDLEVTVGFENQLKTQENVTVITDINDAGNISLSSLPLFNSSSESTYNDTGSNAEQENVKEFVITDTLNPPMAQYTDLDICSMCIHGVCSTNNNGESECTCNPGYHGVYCNSQCLKECLNGGICYVFKDVEYCRCKANFHGEFCEEQREILQTTSTSPPTTTITQNVENQSNQVNIYTKTLGERFCATNFECVNGVCSSPDPRRPKCKCAEGYIGVFCQTKCTKQCLNHGKCISIEGTEACNCPIEYEGVFCERKRDHVAGRHLINTNVVKKTRSPSLSKSSVLKYYLLDAMRRFRSPVKSVKKMSDPKKCSENFVCDHGVCDHTRCRCDEGYTGMFCEKECSLNCANEGTCLVLSGRGQVCNCKYGYQGKLCDIPVYFDTAKESERSSNTTESTTTTSVSAQISINTTTVNPNTTTLENSIGGLTTPDLSDLFINSTKWSSNSSTVGPSIT